MTLPIAAAPPSNTSATTSSTATATEAGAKSLAGDQKTFLTLLTAQLKNQDPLSPMDTDQFTQQLVAMNGVQQQIISNQLLQKLVDTKNSYGDPVTLIGGTVTAETPSGKLTAGHTSGWVYSLDAPAKDVTVQVYDSANQLVAGAAMGAQTAGEHAYAWNGKSMSGSSLPDGVYTLKVTAKDAAGKDVSTRVFQRGVVTSVETVDGQPMLNLNGLGVPMSSVSSVSAGNANANANDSSTSDNAANKAAA